jgi:hypothetical protein
MRVRAFGKFDLYQSIWWESVSSMRSSQTIVIKEPISAVRIRVCHDFEL